MLEPPQQPITFADVGGLEDIKEQIRQRIILPFQKPALFSRFKKKGGRRHPALRPARLRQDAARARHRRRVQGRVLQRAHLRRAGHVHRRDRSASCTRCSSSARASTPAVLFFDELEALAGKRQYSREGTAAKLVSQFLSEMDGFAQNNQGVLIMGATNVPWAIDPAFRRPGRFDRMLFVPPPDHPARAAILKLLLADRPAAPTSTSPRWRAARSAFSGADLGQPRRHGRRLRHRTLAGGGAGVRHRARPISSAPSTRSNRRARVAVDRPQLRALRERVRPIRRGAGISAHARARHERPRGYRILDEPTPGALAAYVVNPTFPMLRADAGGHLARGAVVRIQRAGAGQPHRAPRDRPRRRDAGRGRRPVVRVCSSRTNRG